MSLDVALQSVAFYVLSCSTCAKISHRRKAKKQAAKEREEKHALETEQPGLYRHPSPFSTNPYWTEEIIMGPTAPKRKGGGSKNTSQRALNTAGQGSSYASSGATALDGVTDSPTTATEGSRISGEGWNTKRYQREDEDLWGHDTYGPGQRIMDAIAKAGSSAGRLLEGRLSTRGKEDIYMKEEAYTPYYAVKNPPVNDLHPPIVSTQPTSRDQTKWMLQPPPPAKVMEGKERVNRNRAGSNGSSRRGLEGTPLSRIVTERLVDQKLQRGETPSLPEISAFSTPIKPSSGVPTVQSRDRSTSASSSESSGSSDSGRRKRRPPPIKTSNLKMSRDRAQHIPLPSTGTEMSERAARPILSTVVSSSNVIPQVKDNALRELVPLSSTSMDCRTPSPSSRLPPSMNAMPASISSQKPSITTLTQQENVQAS